MTKSASYYFWLIIALGGIFLAVFNCLMERYAFRRYRLARPARAY